jgi:hypothetical protein
MKIELADPERDHRLRRQTRKQTTGRARRAMQSFETVVAQPFLPARRPDRPERAEPAPKKAEPRPRAQATPARPAQEPARARQKPRAAATPASHFVVLLRVAAVLAVVGLAGLVVYGSTAAQFFVYSATVAGAPRLSAEAIYQAAAVHEQNIFWVRPAEAEERIAQLNGVKSVHVSARLPAQVRIEIQEREPAVMWRVEAQQHDWWLDEEGVVLPYHGDVNNTLFVVDSTPRELHEGDRLQPDGMVASVRQLAAALPGNNVFYFAPDRGLSFLHTEQNGDKWPVFVGTSEDLPHKIAVLQTLTEYLLAHNIRPRYIDVRWPDHPVYGAPGSQASQPGG